MGAPGRCATLIGNLNLKGPRLGPGPAFATGKAPSSLSGTSLSRGFGLSAGAEVAGSATLVRRHLPVRKRHGLHLRCGDQSRWHFPSFGFRPARRSGAERSTVGISCARERDSQRAV